MARRGGEGGLKRTPDPGVGCLCGESRAWIVVRYKGHAAESIVDDFLRLTEPTQRDHLALRNDRGSSRAPFRLEPRDRKIIDAMPPFLFAHLKPGVYDVVVTVVDVLGNRYEADAFPRGLYFIPSDGLDPTIIVYVCL